MIDVLFEEVKGRYNLISCNKHGLVDAEFCRLHCSEPVLCKSFFENNENNIQINRYSLGSLELIENH